MTDRHDRRRIPRSVWLRALLLVAIVAAAFVVARWSPVASWFDDDRLVELLTGLRGLWWAPPLLIVLYVVFASLAVPAAPLMVAGAAFGPVYGFLYNMAGLFAGAAASYLLALVLGRDFVVHIAGRRMQRAERAFRRHGFWPLVQTRFLPIPFTAVNFGAALAGVPPAMFLLAAFVGLVPSTLIHSYFIATLIETSGPDRWPYLVAYGATFLLFNLLIGIPWIVQQRRRRRRYLKLQAARAARDRRTAPPVPDRRRAGSGPGDFLRFTVAWLRDFRWSWRRLAIVVAYLLVLPLIELWVWAGLLADRLFFPGHGERRVTAPVFIVGNFRSGTTRLHRLLARDTERFATMRMWQILFAPSITGQRLISGLARLDRRFGASLHRLVAVIDRDWDRRNPMHQASLAQPEEDDYLLLHIWSALTIGLSSGLLDEAEPYRVFDQGLTDGRRRRIMGFYRSCIQRFLHAEARDGRRTYLAKNPALTPKIRTILEHFPDARFIVMVRDPRHTIPSFLSMMQMSWRIVGADPTDPALPEFLVDMADHWYRYPAEVLGGLPPDRSAVVVYGDLVHDPAGTVRSIYQRFGFELGGGMAAMLENEAAAARSYRSRHRYSAADLDLDTERLAERFADVIEEYGFDREPKAAPAASEGPPRHRGSAEV
jgi:uncharacterized membrane protein YdjX (TVP38/TMEM64 family)